MHLCVVELVHRGSSKEEPECYAINVTLIRSQVNVIDLDMLIDLDLAQCADLDSLPVRPIQPGLGEYGAAEADGGPSVSAGLWAISRHGSFNRGVRLSRRLCMRSSKTPS